MLEKGWRVRGAVRSPESASRLPEGLEVVQVGPVNDKTDWSQALRGVDTVVHLAGMTHIINAGTKDLLSNFRSVNVAGTKRLAQASTAAGVRRFIYVSSIGVNGEHTDGNVFREDDMPQPVTAYAISKLEAERVLRQIAKETGMEIVIVRPPLVYGPAAPGNFSRLMRLIKSGLPLPLAGAKGLRSFIYIGNLTDALCECVEKPQAAGNTFLVSDGEDISTAGLIKMIASSLGRKPFLLPFPIFALQALSRITGKAGDINKLTQSLIIDSSKIRSVLNWKASFTVKEGIAQTVAYYRNHEKDFNLEHKICICRKEDDVVVYSEKINWSEFSAYDFSARRDRKIQHYRIVRCNNCGLVRSDPVLSDKDIASFYKDCKLLDKQISSLAAKTYIRLLSSYLGKLKIGKNIDLLEVGCGDGIFLKEALALNINKVVGIEPSVDACRYAEENIKSYIINDIFKKDYFKPETFDIVCSFHVLDHLSDPEGFLRESRRIIKNNGLIILICHDVDAIVNRVMGGKSPVFDIEHIFLFNRKTLRNLVKASGFTVIDEGGLKNTYPLYYWLKYFPLLNKIVRFLPSSISNHLLTISAGNIFICAQKK
jgi:nucleoside-diphosphate-sugar epimerase/SAM-dependent methyltransferase